MKADEILVLGAEDVASTLAGRELDVIRTVQHAYQAHRNGQSSLPHSTFLHFPDDRGNRIIALPAYLGAQYETAGVKWIASFPGNHEQGLARASAVLILNSSQTGRPEAIMEGSIISAQRTAASAALGARSLHADSAVDSVGLIGSGLINQEIVRFLVALYPGIRTLVVFDLHQARAEQFKHTIEQRFGGVRVVVAPDIDTVLGSAALISIATTAAQPHINNLAACAPGSTILHISLRDLSPEVILACDNVVDDVDHVCRAGTSLHLTEQMAGHRRFIRCTLADVLSGSASPRGDRDAIAVFSPFGLGILDLAVGKLVCDRAVETGCGTVLTSFLPL